MKICHIDGCQNTDLASRSPKCKPHQREQNRDNYRKNSEQQKARVSKRKLLVRTPNRAFVIEHLKSNPCVDCGNTDIEVLQFDHRDRATKNANINQLLDGSRDRLIEEISKCDIRCANCHIKRTRRQLGWWTVDSLAQRKCGFDPHPPVLSRPELQ